MPWQGGVECCNYLVLSDLSSTGWLRCVVSVASVVSVVNVVNVVSVGCVSVSE